CAPSARCPPRRAPSPPRSSRRRSCPRSPAPPAPPRRAATPRSATPARAPAHRSRRPGLSHRPSLGDTHPVYNGPKSRRSWDQPRTSPDPACRRGRLRKVRGTAGTPSDPERLATGCVSLRFEDVADLGVEAIEREGGAVVGEDAGGL